MKQTELTQQQIDRFIRKTAQKFTDTSSDPILTDIHIRASQDSGDLMSFDDNEQEITRCVVDEWIENKEDDFDKQVSRFLQAELCRHKELIESLNIMMPYSFILEDEEGANIAELYLVDDDTVIIGGDLMEGLDSDLDEFFKHLIEEE